MNYLALTNYWIKLHNEKYPEYLMSSKEPRYAMKSFFLNSYCFLKALGGEWASYIERYDDLFRRDPSNDFYGKRDPTDTNHQRDNSLEWSTAFEIAKEVGFPHNESAKTKFLRYSNLYLSKAMESGDLPWTDFMLSSAIANLPNEYPAIQECFSSRAEQWLKKQDISPHQLIAYLKGIKNCQGNDTIVNEIYVRLLNWIENPAGTADKQILIWARLVVNIQSLGCLTEDTQNKIKRNFLDSLSKVYSLSSNWLNSPLILQAYYECASPESRDDIKNALKTTLCPSNFLKFRELFPFLKLMDEAAEVNETTQIKEKCKSSVSKAECEACINKKQEDCWIRVISKLTNTKPDLHSGYEVADKVIYSLQQGVYIVIKATPILKQIGEGDVLFRQCVSLFSSDHALVLYLNPFQTAPSVIENIKQAASDSKKNPRFEVIDQKYIRQIYREYATKFLEFSQ
ncbi:MAG: hypothetical protein ABR909_11775 [Candidatus Bathyarchaeia archaeon]|jgi:hypothetical protein